MKLDIIGDVHGCFDELLELIDLLGYDMSSGIPIHQEQRTLAFVGDCMDRGPSSLQTMALLFNMQDKKALIYSPGNHCDKFYRYALGRQVQLQHGIETTIAELDALPQSKRAAFLKRYKAFYEQLPLFHTLDDKRLMIAHAGISKNLMNSTNKNKVRSFVLFGEHTGEHHPDGRPIRGDWAQSYNGKTFIVYGHTPVPTARFLNNTVNIDTGVVFGGKLTALRYPEKEIVSVPSQQSYQPGRFTTYDQ